MVNGTQKNRRRRIFFSGNNLIFFFLLPVASLLFLFFVADPSAYYFLNDDFVQIPQAASGHFFHGTLFRPISDLSILIDYTIWHKQATGYHLSNLLFHLADACLVFLLSHTFFRQFRPTEDDRLKSIFICLIFLVYGYHAEPILWIIGRGATLGALFFLPAVYFYLLRRNSTAHWMISLLCFVAALFTYESVWIFPLVIIILSAAAWIATKERIRREIKYPVSVLAVFLLFLLARILVNGSIAGGYELHTVLSGNFARLFYNYHTLLARAILPPLAEGKFFLGLYVFVLLLLGSLSAYLMRSKRTGILFWILICLFLVSPLPVLSLGIDTHDSESERFIYLPSFFFLLFLAELFHLLVKQKWAFITGLSILLVLHAYQFYREAKAYREAGEIMKVSLQFISQHAADKKIYVAQLPTQLRGALIFRMHDALPAALNWLGGDKKTDRVIILSSRELQNSDTPLQLRKITLAQGQQETIPDCSFDLQSKQLILDGPGGRINFEGGKDILFYWEKGTLTCIE